MNSALALTIWTCCKCSLAFVDADDHPELKGKSGAHLRHLTAVPVTGIEPREHWLGPTEPVCNTCAQLMGLEEE